MDIILHTPNASDDALGILPLFDDEAEFKAVMPEGFLEKIYAARAFANEHGGEVHLRDDGLECEALMEYMGEAWSCGVDRFVVFPICGVFYRMTHDDNRQAEVEFEVSDSNGNPL